MTGGESATWRELFEFVLDEGEDLKHSDALDVSESLGFGWRKVVQRRRLRYPAGLTPDGRDRIFAVASPTTPPGNWRRSGAF